MLRFLSKRFAKHPAAARGPDSAGPRPRDRNNGGSVRPDDPNFLACHVALLDGEEVLYMIHKRALGNELFDKVCFNLELYEKEYFGLHYVDNENIYHWLDPTKSIKKQITIGKKSYTLHLKVKFFPSQPNSVKEELTKYLLYLQLKQEVKEGTLPVPVDLSVQLSALVVQNEVGDFDPDEHDIGLISEFRFLPAQSESYENDVLDAWAQLRGFNPAQCEDRYLAKVKEVEMYGVSMHEVFGKDGNTYRLGLTPFGMLIYDNGVRIGLFFWQKMEKLAFKHKRLVIQVIETDSEGENHQLHHFEFTLQSSKRCKHLWKCAVEYHTFYRMQAANANFVRPRQSFVRLGSKFRYSGRTEAQLKAQSSRAPQPKRQVQFERKPSKRYTRRESYRIRQKISQNQDDSSVRVASTSQLSLNLSKSSGDAAGRGSNHYDNLIEFSPTSHTSHHSSRASGGERSRLIPAEDGNAPPRPPLPPALHIDTDEPFDDSRRSNFSHSPSAFSSSSGMSPGVRQNGPHESRSPSVTGNGDARSRLSSTQESRMEGSSRSNLAVQPPVRGMSRHQSSSSARQDDDYQSRTAVLPPVPRKRTESSASAAKRIMVTEI